MTCAPGGLAPDVLEVCFCPWCDQVFAPSAVCPRCAQGLRCRLPNYLIVEKKDLNQTSSSENCTIIRPLGLEKSFVEF